MKGNSNMNNEQLNSSYITKVYLLDVPLESDYKNTLYFASETAQHNYFETSIVKSYTDFAYQRKDKLIRIPDIYDNIYHCNYVMYQNSNYNNKWFYCFIDKMEYISDGRTDVYITTDVMQTWAFDYTLKPSFIEREHTNNDTIGNNLIDEGLELGDYTCNGHHTDSNMDSLLSDLCYVIGSTIGTILDGDKFPSVGGDVYNGIYSGVKYYRYDTPSSIDILLQMWANKGQSDGTTGIFLAPKFLAPLNTQALEREVLSSNTTQNYSITMSKNYGLNGYSPRNNKLKTFPFCYMLASNNQGGNAIYHYEDFSTSSCNFTVKGALAPGCSIRMTPNNFKGVSENDEESINLGKFPICNFTTDMYTNWLTQNSVNLTTQTATNLLQIGGGILLLGSGSGALAGGGMIANGLLGITNTMGEKRRASLVPPQVNGNLNCGDVITASSKNNFHFYNMSIKSQIAQTIDGYFDMFGYKVNAVKIPYSNHRERWWYTKTIDINLDGNIPNEDIQKIKDCYNNGITFWKNASEIQNYSLSNNIV